MDHRERGDGMSMIPAIKPLDLHAALVLQICSDARYPAETAWACVEALAHGRRSTEKTSYAKGRCRMAGIPTAVAALTPMGKLRACINIWRTR